MNFKKQAITFTVIAVILAVIVGFLQYKNAVKFQEEQAKIKSVKEDIDFARQNAAKEDVRLKLSTASKNLDELRESKPEIVKGPSTWNANDVNLFNYIPKLIFSLIFCAAGLYVILSNKYSEETQKWAFGIIGVIVGVWIGSV